MDLYSAWYILHIFTKERKFSCHIVCINAIILWYHILATVYTSKGSFLVLRKKCLISNTYRICIATEAGSESLLPEKAQTHKVSKLELLDEIGWLVISSLVLKFDLLSLKYELFDLHPMILTKWLHECVLSPTVMILSRNEALANTCIILYNIPGEKWEVI
jgi:hypothetical protein